MSLHARRPPRGVERRFGGCEVGFSRGAADRRRRDPQPFSRGRALAGLASSAALAGARAALQGVVRGGISEGRAPRAPVTAAVTRRSRGSHGAIDRGSGRRAPKFRAAGALHTGPVGSRARGVRVRPCAPSRRRAGAARALFPGYPSPTRIGSELAARSRPVRGSLRGIGGERGTDLPTRAQGIQVPARRLTVSATGTRR